MLLLAGCRKSSSFYPLDAGLTLEYQALVTPSNRPPTSLVVSITNLPSRRLNGQVVTPQKLDFGGQSTFSFLASDGAGVQIYAQQGAADTEPKVSLSPTYYLKFPLSVGAKWSGTIQTALLNDTVGIATETVVESVSEAVTVAAGTFEDCVKTKITGRETKPVSDGMFSATFSIEEYLWYCPGAGLTKLILREDEITHVNRFSDSTDTRRYSMELSAIKK